MSKEGSGSGRPVFERLEVRGPLKVFNERLNQLPGCWIVLGQFDQHSPKDDLAAGIHPPFDLGLLRVLAVALRLDLIGSFRGRAA